MSSTGRNHYERAFEAWLSDNKVRFTPVDQSKRTAFGRAKIKSFDFLLYPPNQPTIIAEVKGRKFKGSTFEKLAGFECWVSREDVDGLANWQRVFGKNHLAVFVFAYRIENIDVDFDGREVYESSLGRYVFFAVRLDEYRRCMKLRSPKWQTLNLPAEKFRQSAVQMQQLLF